MTRMPASPADAFPFGVPPGLSPPSLASLDRVPDMDRASIPVDTSAFR